MKEIPLSKVEAFYKNYSYESPGDFIWIYLVGGCGCGDDDISEDIWKTLLLVPEKGLRGSAYEDKYVEVLAHLLDVIGLINHGTSIYGSWLTETGKWLIKSLKEKPKSE